jgi:WhiB family redox-sensing transcriptional regulator
VRAARPWALPPRLPHGDSRAWAGGPSAGRKARATVDTGWKADAACATADPELFFHPDGREDTDGREAKAKAVCRRCPVTAACLAYAETTREFYGIWGGLTETERQRRRIIERRHTG